MTTDRILDKAVRREPLTRDEAYALYECTPVQELAEQFINFMCSEEIAAENRDYINYSTPQQQVLDNLPDEIKNDPVQYPDEETLARCEIYKDLGDMASTYDEFWTKIMVN